MSTAAGKPILRPWLAQAYQLSVIGAAGAVVASAAVLHVPELRRPELVLWVLAVALVDAVPVPAWGELQLSLSFPILLAAAIVYPPTIAASVALVGSFDLRELRREISVMKALFVRSQIALSVVVGSALFHSIASIRPPSAWSVLVLAVLLATAGDYTINTVLVAVYQHVTTGVRAREVISHLYVGGPAQFFVSYLALGLFALIVARSYLQLGFWSLAVSFAPLMLARQMFHRTRALEEATAELSERERALQALSDELAERNGQLAEQALMLQQHLAKEQEAVAELRKLNRMKSEFVAMASHELRTPLTTIIGFAKTLRRHEFAENPSLREEFLDAMERQGERLLRLVENLLTAAHLEDDRLSVTADNVLLPDLLRGVLEGLGPVASRVRIDLSAGPPELQTDRQLLSRVVANLLDNAIKYSRDDGVCDLSTRLEGEEVVITVRDQGIGIPADEIDRIFEPFYQVDSSDTRTFAGVGLGLSLVKRVLGALGGSIEVFSRVGRGSTFIVRVPVRFRERTVGSSDASHPGGGQMESPEARQLRRPA